MRLHKVVGSSIITNKKYKTASIYSPFNGYVRYWSNITQQYVYMNCSMFGTALVRIKTKPYSSVTVIEN